jgi:hypothetical protein
MFAAGNKWFPGNGGRWGRKEKVREGGGGKRRLGKGGEGQKGWVVGRGE